MGNPSVSSAALTRRAFVPRPNAIVATFHCPNRAAKHSGKRSIGSMPVTSTAPLSVEKRKSSLSPPGIDAKHALCSIHGCWVSTITIGTPPTCG